ncbi:MAG: hypothetical protein AB7G05_10845, partial [Hyphomonadaceae bacterium]
MGKSGSIVTSLLAGFLSAAASLGLASAQTPLFAEDSELAVTIEAPFSTLVRTAARNTDPHPATFTVGDQSFPFEIAARGRTRRTAHCSFPPLRLDFDNDELEGTLLDGQNRIKLVTHCQPRTTSEQFVVREYLAYRLYNAITPESFRVRAVRVTYRDSEGRRPEDTRFGFLIEDADDAARRNRMDEVDAPGVSGELLQARAGARYALFEFMISNLDWSFQNPPRGEEKCCHNSRLISTGGAMQNIVPLPYDFDNSGWVDSPYAIPPAGFGDNVRTRRYRGLCRHNEAVPEAVALFQARRAQLEALVSGETRLSEPTRRGLMSYLGSFFAVLDDPSAVERQLINGCRN